MRNVILRAGRGLLYVLAALLLIRYVRPLGYLTGTLQDRAYHLFSSEGLGWINDASEWGDDWASFWTAILCVLVLAWLLSLPGTLLLKKFRR